jgi:hypothetical protein
VLLLERNTVSSSLDNFISGSESHVHKTFRFQTILRAFSTGKAISCLCLEKIVSFSRECRGQKSDGPVDGQNLERRK